MANICEGCGESVYRTILVGKKWLGADCGCTRMARIMASTQSAFGITLQHVHNEFGQPIKVENIRQLSAAEKRYGFESVVLNSDAQNFDDPPQQKRVSVADLHNWKFSNRKRFSECRR